MFCWAGFVGVVTGDSGKRFVSPPVVVLLSNDLHHIRSSSGMPVLMDGGIILGEVSSISIFSEIGG